MGSTNDWSRRLIEHNHSEKNTYTSKYRPWKILVVFVAGESRSQALEIERFIKAQKSRKLIEKLVDTSFKPDGKLSQLVRVPHMRD